MASNNSINSLIPIQIAFGGTNATSSLGLTVTDGTIYFDGTRFVTTPVGSATEVFTSNGVGQAPSFQPAPATSMFFQVLAADPAMPINSQVWYNSTSNTFKGYQNGATVTFTVS